MRNRGLSAPDFVGFSASLRTSGLRIRVDGS